MNDLRDAALAPKPASTQGRWGPRTWLTLILCWLVAVNLRTVVLGVSPVLPNIQHDLGISNTALGLLTALPVLCMGFLAWPSAAVIARVGGRVGVALGLALLTLGAVLRSVPGNTLSVFAFTLILSIGVTLGQTTLPILVRQWFPARIGLASAVYTNGLVIGETVAVAVTGPVLLRLFGRDAWPATFIAWSVPVAGALLLWLLLAPPAPPLGFAANVARPQTPTPAPPAAPPAQRARATAARAHRPARAWHLGVLLGSGSLVYFGMNAWIPPYDQALGRSAATAGVLATLNAAQLPVSLALMALAQRLVGRRWPFIAAGVVVLAGLAGWLWAPPASGAVWAALLGAASAFVFMLATALPPLLAEPEAVAHLTGMTLSIGYSVAFFGPLLGGSLWDAWHAQPAIVFLPVGVAGIILVALGAALPAGRFATMTQPHESGFQQR